MNETLVYCLIEKKERIDPFVRILVLLPFFLFIENFVNNLF